MKKFTLLVLSLVLVIATMAQVPSTLPDDFESYTAGEQLADQNPTLWTTWSNAPGGGEDPFVSADNAASGVNSVMISAGNDCVIPLGDLTEGKWNYKFKVLIPTGFTGYYNVLHMFDGTESEWGTQTYFAPDGAGRVDAGAETAATFTYAYDTWIQVETIVNLTFDQATIIIDGTELITWQWSTGSFGDPGMNQLGAGNFYAWDEEGTPGMYIDDVELVEMPLGGIGAPPANLAGEVVDDFNIQLTWEAPGADPIVWDQMDQLGETYGKSAQDFEAVNDVYDAEVSGDFVLTETTTLTKAAFRFFYNADHSANVDPRSFNVNIFADEAGVASETPLYTTTTVEAAPDEEGVFMGDLADAITLDAGTYWIGFNMILDFGTDEIQCYAGQRAAVDNETPGLWRNPGDGFATGFTTWSPDIASEGGDPEEVCFALYGSAAKKDALAAMADYPVVNNDVNYQTVSLNVTSSAVGTLATTPFTAKSRELLGYKIYRDGAVIVESMTDLTYFDTDLDPAAYTYLVSALYTEGESDPAGPITVEITAGIPIIAVTPNVLFANVMYPNTVEKTMTISNNGNGDLMYEIWATYNSDAKTAASVKPHTFKAAPAGTGELVTAQSTTKPYYEGGNSRDLLWDNAGAIGVTTSGLISGGYGGVGATDNLVNGADDFIVPMGEVWTVDFIHTEGFCNDTIPIIPDGFGVIIYGDAFGAPSDEILYEEIVPWTEYEGQDLVLGMPPTLTAGHYWLSVYAWFADEATVDHRWNWYYGTTPIGYEAVLQDQPGFFGGMDWTKIGDLAAGANSMFFVIEGTSVATDNWLTFDPISATVLPTESQEVTVTFNADGLITPANGAYTGTISIHHNDPAAAVKEIPVSMNVISVGIGEADPIYVMVYPNPSNGVLNFQSNEMIRNIRVMNLAGQVIVSNAVNAENYTLNTSDLNTGIYFVQIESASGISTQKVTVK